MATPAEISFAHDKMLLALEFYGNPETYHAVAFFFDSPTGGFDRDFDDDHGDDFYDRPMPGKLAREALAAWEQLFKGDTDD